MITVLDPKTRELAAVAASVAGNCTPCLKYHLAEAAKNGCTKEEVQEVMELADMIKKRAGDNGTPRHKEDKGRSEMLTKMR